MGMRYVDNGQSKNKYFSKEDSEKCNEILREWRPRRYAAIEAGDLTQAPIPPFVAECVKRIAEKIATRYNYRDIHYRDDMVSNAILNLLRYVHTFDPDRIGERSGRVNFFSWATRTIDNSFSETIRLEKQEEYFQLAAFSNMGGFAAFTDSGEAADSDFNMTSEMAQDIVARAREYEENRAEKIRLANERQKAKAAKKEAEQPPKPDKTLLRFYKK